MTFNETGADGTTVSFTSVPESVEAGTTGDFSFEVQVGDPNSPSTDIDAEVKAFLYVNGTNDQSIVASTSSVVTDNDIIQGTLSHTFPTNSSRNERIEGQERLAALNQFKEPTQSQFNSYPRTDEPIWIKVEVDYFTSGGGYNRNNVDETASTADESVDVTRPVDDSQIEQFGQEAGIAGNNTLASTFENRTPFSIQAIEFEDDATYVNSVFDDSEQNEQGYQISFEDYPNPTVSIDTSGRFAKHEIIGGTTVRQKIGEDPINLSINGVCKRRTANQIDALRDAKNGKIISDRLPGSSDGLRVQFGSTMTEPMTDGGSADLTDGRYLYSFQINAIEVIR
jgi:hypothetical protein